MIMEALRKAESRTGRMLTPSAATMVRLEAPARISMPRRVRVTTYQSSAAMARPTPMMVSR